MKNVLIILPGLIFAALVQNTVFAGKIKNFILDNSRIYEIKVAGNAAGTTTVMFPSTLGAIQGANVTNKAGEDAGFVITYNTGSYFFSLQAQKSEASGSLNIVYDHKIYVLKLLTVPENEAFSSVTFQSTDQVCSHSGNGGAITPALIRDLIEKARLYPVLVKQYPDYYENVEISQRNQIFKYTGYSVKLETVYRFKTDDTNIFQITIKNNTDDTLAFDPHLIAVRLNSKMYYSSVTVASGKIPPHGESPVWFAVTGSTDGDRNNMAADNNWKVLLTASGMNQNKPVLDVNTQVLEKENKIKEEITQINQRLNSDDIANGEISLLSKKITKLNKELSRIEAYQNISKNNTGA